MDWIKVILLLLLALLLFQFVYFGLDDCSKCRFGPDKIRMNDFFNVYQKDCLTPPKYPPIIDTPLIPMET